MQKKILIVDDESEVRKYLGEVLECILRYDK